MASSLGNVSTQPYFLKTPDPQLIPQQRQQHNEAVYAYGEYSMFILMWHIEDYLAGACQRCPYCFGEKNPVEAAIEDAYKQAILNKCPQCFGTTYFQNDAARLGGLKARIVRPCMWNTADVTHDYVQQGEVDSSTSTVQSISDFRMRSGDYVFRADQTRWRVETIQTDFIISGFQAASDINAMIGYTYPGCKQEEKTSVAFIIPPEPSIAGPLLNVNPALNYPVDFSTWEVINGELIADDFVVGP
jgi:hypothetical protein